MFKFLDVIIIKSTNFKNEEKQALEKRTLSIFAFFKVRLIFEVSYNG